MEEGGDDTAAGVQSSEWRLISDSIRFEGGIDAEQMELMEEVCLYPIVHVILLFSSRAILPSLFFPSLLRYDM